MPHLEHPVVMVAEQFDQQGKQYACYTSLDMGNEYGKVLLDKETTKSVIPI